jgi:hypothetical protein
MDQRDKYLLTFLTFNATWHYCKVFQKTIFKTVSGSSTIVSQSAQLHEENISKVTAATSAQVSKFCFHRAIPQIKLLHLVHVWRTTRSQTGSATDISLQELGGQKYIGLSKNKKIDKKKTPLSWNKNLSDTVVRFRQFWLSDLNGTNRWSKNENVKK